MMASAIARMRRTVHRQVAKYGTTGTLTRTDTTSVSAGGIPTPGTPVVSPTLAAILPLSEYTDNREEQRSLALRGVRYVVMDAAGMTLVPQSLDVLALGSDSYKIESSTPIDPDGATPIAHQALAVKL